MIMTMIRRSQSLLQVIDNSEFDSVPHLGNL
jgi:hypothetical protein